MSLEDLSFEARDELAQLARTLAENPNTRKDFLRLTKKAKPDLNQNLTEITNSQFSTQIKSSSTQRTQSKKKDDYEVTEEDLDF